MQSFKTKNNRACSVSIKNSTDSSEINTISLLFIILTQALRKYEMQHIIYVLIYNILNAMFKFNLNLSYSSRHLSSFIMRN